MRKTDDRELVVHYTDADGRLSRVFMLVVSGMLTAVPLWLIFLGVNQLLSFVGLGMTDSFVDPNAPWSVVVFVVVLLSPGTCLLGWFTLRVVVIGRRGTRRCWWLRLSSRGFEVNDRLFRPRRYDWRDIDKFMLVAPSAHIADAVGFNYSPAHRRSLANKIFRAISDLQDRDGTKADGLIMGYWDRPFDEAADLMNEWLVRYRAAGRHGD